METRTCKKCGMIKAFDQFRFSNKRRGWRRHECRSCQDTRRANWHLANRKRDLERQNGYYRNVGKKRYELPEYRGRTIEKKNQLYHRLKAAVYAAYGNKCNCCGEIEARFLTIDHVKNDGKEHRAAFNAIGADLYRWAIANDFPDSLQILCFNCNMGKQRNLGVCPHQETSTTRSSDRTDEAIASGSASDPTVKLRIVK